jgi:hypothetical protein
MMRTTEVVIALLSPFPADKMAKQRRHGIAWNLAKKVETREGKSEK